MKKIINQIFKFGIVGIIAFFIDYGLLFVCTEIIGIYYLISSLISFCVSVIFNYIASILWVFDVDNKKNKIDNFLIFIVLSIIGLVINQFLMWLGVDVYNLHYMFTKIGATALVMVYNFITRKIFLEK